jgi:hypothetical protein
VPDDEPDPRVEIIWTLAQGQLASQTTTVDELRARVGILISGAAIATGFLAGQALDAKHRIPDGAWLGIAAAFALLLVCIIILWPRKWSGQLVNTTKALEDIDRRPDDRVDDFQRYMADYAMKQFRKNERRLKVLYRLFSVALICLGVDFAGWIWALAQQ